MPANSIHDDQLLFERIAEGDEAAFEQLYNVHVLAVSRIVFRLMQSESITRDVVQEVFLKLWLSRHKLVEITDPHLYIYRIAYNCSFDHLRQEQAQERAKAQLGVETELQAQDENGQAVVDFRETTRLIVQAVNSLPSRSREIYQLNRMQGLKPQAIADQLGISVQSVRNSLTRSAQHIRDYLELQGISLPAFLILLPFSELFG